MFFKNNCCKWICRCWGRCLALWLCCLGIWSPVYAVVGKFSNGLPAHTIEDVPKNTINAHILLCVKNMPSGGGYSTNKETFMRLCQDAVFWDSRINRLVVRPEKAQPSFCSAACYLVLLQLLMRWDNAQPEYARLLPQHWQLLDICLNTPDGTGIWGRVNANGPGFAKLMTELRAGLSFDDVTKARPGDFLKIFWTEEIGGRERGHLVVFLGFEALEAGQYGVKFWSSNLNGGYGEKVVPMDAIKRYVFTRITNLSAFRHVDKMPAEDLWLESLLREKITPAEMKRQAGIK